MKVFLSQWYKFKMYTRILVPSFCIAFVIFKTCFSVKISTIVSTTETDVESTTMAQATDDIIEPNINETQIDSTSDSGMPDSNESETVPPTLLPPIIQNGTQNQSKTKVFKKLQIPRGTSLTLTAQVSKPKILPGFFFDDDGIILDAVIEIPIWLDLDRFVEAMYHQGEETDAGIGAETTGKKRKKDSFAGKERCFLYKELELFIGSVMPIPQGLPRACLLRTICEIQSLFKFYDSQPKSLLVEMLHLILSPSLGAQDGCNSIYLKAESVGKYGYCKKYITQCPLNIASLIKSHSVNPFA